MAAKYDNVIIFGPTGAVGGAAALEASKRGAKVWLAMRDTSKAIEGIPGDVEKAGRFERVQADLTDPDSVGAAVKKSGAKAAYVYLVFGSTDHMRGTLQALKNVGIEYVVFLSSFSITTGTDLRSIPPEHIIPYSHAQVEIAIEEVGFPYVTALRPASFASNHIKMSVDRSTKPPRANILYADAMSDNIVPEDIGTVGGAVLVERPSNGKEIIYLAGPEFITTEKVWDTIKRVTGRTDIDTKPIDGEEFSARVGGHMPPPMIKEFLRVQEQMRQPETLLSKSEFQQAVANIKKFSGREPTKFQDYVEAQKAEWLAL